MQIGGRPIIWHIMDLPLPPALTNSLSAVAIRGHMIKSYSSIILLKTTTSPCISARTRWTFHGQPNERWQVTLVDTGLSTMTGGRVKRIAPYVGNETFCLTYGDGVSDVDIRALVDFHRKQGRLATVTAVPSPGRFGILDIDDNETVSRFHEKPDNEMGWIAAGSSSSSLRPWTISTVTRPRGSAPLERLARDNALAAYRPKASGNQWIRCATGANSKRSGYG